MDCWNLTFEDVLDRSANLVIVYLHYLVQQLLADTERLFADDLYRGAVAERTNFLECYALALRDALGHGIAVEGFYTDYARARTSYALNVLSDTGNKASTTNRAENGVKIIRIGELLEDL